MAKIKQVKLRLGLDPTRDWLETTVAINYDATDRNTQTYSRPIPPDDERFYIKLPKMVADALGIDKAKAGGQDEVVAKFMEIIDRFKSMETTVNQVILYKIEVEPLEGKRDFGRGQRKVQVWAGTYEEMVAIAGDGAERYSYSRVASEVNFADDDGEEWYDLQRRSAGARRFENQVPWTDQTAAFFIWIKSNLDLLISRLYELEQPEKMIEAITAGRLLPLGNSGGKHGK